MTQTSTPQPSRSPLLSRLARRAIRMVEAVEQADLPITYLEISRAANALMAVTRVVERLFPVDDTQAPEITQTPVPEGDDNDAPKAPSAPLNRQRLRNRRGCHNAGRQKRSHGQQRQDDGDFHISSPENATTRAKSRAVKLKALTLL